MLLNLSIKSVCGIQLQPAHRKGNSLAMDHDDMNQVAVTKFPLFRMKGESSFAFIHEQEPIKVPDIMGLPTLLDVYRFFS